MAFDTCGHIGAVADDNGVIGVAPGTDGCVDCLAAGDQWLHLRRCLECELDGRPASPAHS